MVWDVADDMLTSTDSGLAPGTADNPVSESGDHFFEGVEKLLEVWFHPKKGGNNSFDLRKVLTRKVWQEDIFPKVECYIMSEKSDPHQTAYVLSESSLFVTKNKYILKTCGTTKCLASLELIQEMMSKGGEEFSGIEISYVFYSRKNFLKFEKQDGLYRNDNFQCEHDHLEKLLNPTCDTKSYQFGRVSGSRWFVFTAENFGFQAADLDEGDQTLEILMLGLDRKVMKQNFYGQSSAVVKKNLGLPGIIEDLSVYDDQIFEPCGYSANGLIDPKKQTEGYLTIHVTPEPEFSYVSFETNANYDLDKTIEKVVATFQPREYTVTLIASRKSKCFRKMYDWLGDEFAGQKALENEGPKLADKQFCSFGTYSVIYKHFSSC